MSTLKVNNITNLSNQTQYSPTLMTAQASTSGTSIDFTGIPSWVKRITVMFSGVSTNGTSNYLIRLGSSGGIEDAGYTGVCNSTSGTSVTNTTGILLSTSMAAANNNTGIITIANVTGNLWVASLVIAYSAPSGFFGGSTKTLSGTLDRIRITTVNGTDTFDAGTINVMYE